MSVNCLVGCLKPAWVAAISATFTVFYAGPAAACSVRLGPVTTIPIAYDPFVIGSNDGWIRVTADLVDGESCETVVAITDAGATPLRTVTFGPDHAVTFRARLRRAAGVREGSDPAEATVSLSLANPHVEVAWQLQNESEGILAPGEYSAPVWANVRNPQENFGPSIGAISLRSVARAQINLAGTAASYEFGSDAATIDLGELHNGSSGRAFLQLRGNTQAHLSFTSRQQGYLTNGMFGARIPYRLTFDGKPIDLTRQASVAVDAPPTLRGSSFALDATVGDVTDATAGRYSDAVIIDVSP